MVNEIKLFSFIYAFAEKQNQKILFQHFAAFHPRKSLRKNIFERNETVNHLKMVQLAFVQVRLKKKCTFSCFSLSRRFISCSHLETLSYFFKLNHEERKCHRHTNSLQKIVQDIHLRTFGMINENFCKGTKQNNKDNTKKIEITFNIMFLPNVKYPAAVKVGH